MKRTIQAALLLSLLSVFACGDDAPSMSNGDPDMSDEEMGQGPIRCTTSADCDEIDVCRDGICVPGPRCGDSSDCEAGESCLDEYCVYDPEACVRDSGCEGEGMICEAGGCRVGCRNNAACGEDQECTDDFVCVDLPCTETGCDDGYDCNAETGLCDLRACNGGCEAPLACRTEDDTCVMCFEDEECELAELCMADGFCMPQPCEAHDECPEETFCINQECLLPPTCIDDPFEDNDDIDNAILVAEGTTSGLVSCPFDDDYLQIASDGDHSLTVEVRFLHEDGNIDMELLNQVGVTVVKRISMDDNETAVLNVFSRELFTLHVFQEAGTQGVPYEVFAEVGQSVPVEPDLCAPDGFEPNDESATATEIFTGRWTGPTACAGDEDYYKIEALAGELLRVCVTPSELFDVPLGLQVQYEDGEVLLEGAGATMFCVEDDLLIGDEYRARVFALNEGEETPYHITFEIEEGCRLFDDMYDQMGLNNFLPLDEDDDPLFVLPPEDTPIELRVCPENSDYWPVDLLRRDQLNVDIEFEHDDGNIQLKLLRPTGSTVVASVSSTDREAIRYQAELDGTHIMRVYGESGAMGIYTFTYEVIPYCEPDAFEADGGDAGSGRIDIGDEGTVTELSRCAGDDDWWTFTIPDTVTPTSLEVRVDYDTTGDPLHLEVRPPSGTVEDFVAGTPETDAEVVTFTEMADLLTGDGNEFRIHVYADELEQNYYELTVTVTPE